MRVKTKNRVSDLNSILASIGSSLLAGMVALLTAEACGGTIEKGDFSFAYDERGITGLANPNDPFGAQILPQGQRLGLMVRFRVGDGDWQTLSAGSLRTDGSTSESRLAFANDGPLKAIQTFTTDGAALDWNIELESATNLPVEIGDFSI